MATNPPIGDHRNGEVWNRLKTEVMGQERVTERDNTIGDFVAEREEVELCCNLTRVSSPTAKGDEMEFWLSDPEELGNIYDEWGFSLFADKDVFLATFIYADEETALTARKAIEPLRGVTFPHH